MEPCSCDLRFFVEGPKSSKSHSHKGIYTQDSWNGICVSIYILQSGDHHYFRSEMSVDLWPVNRCTDSLDWTTCPGWTPWTVHPRHERRRSRNTPSSQKLKQRHDWGTWRLLSVTDRLKRSNKTLSFLFYTRLNFHGTFTFSPHKKEDKDNPQLTNRVKRIIWPGLTHLVYLSFSTDRSFLPELSQTKKEVHD